ncbi:hypothetical protein [Luethyella okanaganae]|uniref:Transposase n=1 Tax=Luethyella okanaganae TaxID=69372 RepID=A0ABW1VE00_9MICO
MVGVTWEQMFIVVIVEWPKRSCTLAKFERQGRVGMTQLLDRDPVQAVVFRGRPLQAAIPPAGHEL